MPLGHGAKSAMIVKQYMDLTNREMYAIWWHMGFSEGADANAVGGSIELYPIVLALQTADMVAGALLGDIQLFRCAGDAQFTGHHQKYFIANSHKNTFL